MIIIVLADIHGRLDHVPAICGEIAGADVVLIAGDVTNFGKRADARNAIAELRQYNTNILAVSGNCDPKAVDEYMAAEGVNLHCNCVDVDGVSFVGIGGSLSCFGNTPNESPESVFDDCLEKIESQVASAKKFVLVTHQPARSGVVDSVGGKIMGSDTIRDFIVKNQPILAVSGHIHEAIGIDKIGETTLINPGPFRQGRYAYVEIGDGIEKIELRDATQHKNIQ